MLTDVSVQDYWLLLEAGHEPVGLVATSAVVFASALALHPGAAPADQSENQELEELNRAFHAAREICRAHLLGQVSDAHGTGAVGVELSHSVHREKLALASSLNTSDRRGWHRGRSGLPYFVSGRADADRSGWVITMHSAGTAVRRTPAPSELPLETPIRMEAI